MVEYIESLWNAVVTLFLNPFTRTVSIVALSLFVGVLLRLLAGVWMRRIAAQTDSLYDDIIIDALRRTVVYIALFIGMNVAVRELPPSVRTMIMPYARPAINTGIILLITFLVAQVLRQLFKIRASSEDSRIAAMSLTRRIVEFVVYIIGGVMVLRTFGVDVTAIVTALGVGGLAVALALQDTLSNAFAGMYITLARQLRKGDYIKTSDGFEGFVKDIGWRNTTIETIEMNMVFIPNNKLAQSIVLNYFLPKERFYVRVDVGVAYDTDPQLVEDTLIELVRHCGHATPEEAASAEQPAGKIRHLLHTPEPLVRFGRFGDYLLNFRMLVVVDTFDNQFHVQHEVMKQIYYRFRKAGIRIPMPIQTLYFGDGTTNAFTSGVQVSNEVLPVPKGQ